MKIDIDGVSEAEMIDLNLDYDRQAFPLPY
jgi:hypothetical protein